MTEGMKVGSFVGGIFCEARIKNRRIRVFRFSADKSWQVELTRPVKPCGGLSDTHDKGPTVRMDARKRKAVTGLAMTPEGMVAMFNAVAAIIEFEQGRLEVN